MEEENTPSPSPFAALGLRATVVEALTNLGYEAPTPIQERTIPILIAGRDLIGQAQTGTGKTAAFALPILEKIDPALKVTQALVLCPTRELAMQVADAIHTYAQKLDHISVLPVYGGAPILTQLRRLERGAHVVVGTPGRLIDHLDRGSLKLDSLRMIVLDEADEMLKMGFIEDIERILGEAPAERQTALFSATMPDEVLRIAKRYLNKPERVEIEQRTLTAPDIEQRFLNVSEGQKLEVLTQILELEQGSDDGNDAVLIFRRTKNGAGELAEKLEGRGFAAVAMHGDMNQAQRESTIRRLRAGQVEIVVATDVAARGLDVEQIKHVVNYDIPYDVEAYVHRIGRTGRAGRSGVATLFITPRERGMMRAIERYTGMAIKPMKMPSRADVAARRISVFKDSIRKTLTDGDLDLYVKLVEELVDEGEHDVTEIAAATAKLANGERSLKPEPELHVPQERPQRDFAPSGANRYSNDAPRATRHESGPRDNSPRNGDEKKVRLQMSVGRNDGIRPADVVGSIANEAGIPGRDIGPIEIMEDTTFVTVPERVKEMVLDKVGRAKFRGKPVNLRMAESQDVRPRAARGDSDERPARAPYKSRGADDRPARTPYKSRDERPSRGGDDDRPPRAYKPRETGAPTRARSTSPTSFRPRTDGPSRPSFGDRDRTAPPRGARGTFASRSDAPKGKGGPKGGFKKR